MCMLWLLLVTVPLQGLAAVVGGCCVRAQTQSMPSVSVDDKSGTTSAMPCEDPSGMQMTDDGSPGEPSQQHPKKSGSCKPCAACGLGAVAPPSVLPDKIKSTKSDSPVATPPGIFASHISAGLERPPKYLSVIL